jgi:hypothetical protein
MTNPPAFFVRVSLHRAHCGGQDRPNGPSTRGVPSAGKPGDADADLLRPKPFISASRLNNSVGHNHRRELGFYRNRHPTNCGAAGRLRVACREDCVGGRAAVIPLVGRRPGARRGAPGADPGCCCSAPKTPTTSPWPAIWSKLRGPWTGCSRTEATMPIISESCWPSATSRRSSRPRPPGPRPSPTTPPHTAAETPSSGCGLGSRTSDASPPATTS